MKTLTTTEYYEKLLPYYRSMYDMEQPYVLHGIECLAHGHFYSQSERFVLSRKAKLWESRNFEHVFFIEREELSLHDLKAMDEAIRSDVEPQLVRNGKPYPDSNHMYTYMTFVFLCGSAVNRETRKAVKKYHYSRNYLFTFRGWCEAKVAVVDVSECKVYTNAAGRTLTKLLGGVLQKK